MTGFDPTEIVLVPRVRTLQIITCALAAGCFLFAGAAYFVRNQQVAAGPVMPLITYLAAGFFAVQLALSGVWPLLTLPGQLKRLARGELRFASQVTQPAAYFASDAGKLLAVFQGQHIVRMALIEGGAFFNGMAFILNGEWLSLGLLAGGGVLILGQLPTVGRVSRWLENRLLELETLRAQGDFRPPA